MLVNSTQFIHVRGSSYIIITNYEKRRPHVWDVYAVGPSIWSTVMAIYMSLLLIADRSTKILKLLQL